MRILIRNAFFYVLLLLWELTGCVDAIELDYPGTVDVVVVEGTLTDLAEPQIIRLSRSKSDPLTGRPGFLTISGAKVEVLVDSAEVVEAFETVAGTYRLPADFRGKVGHAYQLRFTLSDGTRYESSQQIMPAVPPIGKVTAEFNPKSISPLLVQGHTAGHDFFLDTQDPADQSNYYRWDWRLWESRRWCRTCEQGAYSIYNVVTTYDEYGGAHYETGDNLFESCFYPPRPRNGLPTPYWVYDYECRTQCWAILWSSELNLFADSYTNGGAITHRKVAQIPFYQRAPALVEIRQLGLTPAAYRFFKDLQDQTQNNGGVADPPPTASVGNVKNAADPREITIGFFTASSVATARYWLDRSDAIGVPPGLFMALMGREPIPEPPPPGFSYIQIVDTKTTSSRPYTAVCVENEKQTAQKPVGWQQ
ncbi:DUF4249 domain-containing protein [Salmonirosea aquatica]|uniref:DUF4249 family protein n=1 Tax=Salmonirosea aquatica TaxID=2654236 RepID=A0A7C9BQT6_9BACT|nr:DUF4249 family protein [Cytophagaceae bacterium SJW1-29]